MNFIKNNLFLVVLLLVVVLAGTGLIVWGTQVSGKISTEQMPARLAITKELATLNRPPYHNKETNKEALRRSDEIIEMRDHVKKADVIWNRKQEVYTIPQMKLLNQQKIPAFPMEYAVWDKNEIFYYYIQDYYFPAVDEILTSLEPASLPTQDEINELAKKKQQEIDIQEQINRKRRGESVSETPTERPSTPMGMRAAGGADVSVEAMEQARAQLRQESARSGKIYATENSLDVMFYRKKMYTSSRALVPEIWEAQLSLWLQRDIVAAIQKTNQKIWDEQNVPEAQRNVITAPIKQLISVRMERPYRQARATLPEEDRRGGRDTKPTPMAAGRLTQRSVSKDHEVIPYLVRVRMPAMYVQRFQESLTEQNYHTVVNQDIRPAATPPATEPDLHYYGGMPVSDVSLEVEWVLLSAWARGTYDAEAEEGTWTWPPLMPREVIQTLPREALREQDEDLLEGKIKIPQPTEE